METMQTQLIINKHGPVIIIEDTLHEQEFLSEIFRKLNYRNKILFFFDEEQALEYINTTDDLPFLILSDIQTTQSNDSNQRSTHELEKAIRVFMEYWPRCATPNALCV